MFLKSLKIENNESIVREILFSRGINLIVDETQTQDRQESGNNVGKTTVLRLIDYCLGSDGKNIYKDTEFKTKTNSQIEHFLLDNNIIISLTLVENLEDDTSNKIEIRRNFLKRGKQIQEINGENYNSREFPKKLKELIFHSNNEKPTFRQIIAKNIRDEKNKLLHTIKVLHPTTTLSEYETLYLFWLGIDLDISGKKQKFLAEKKIEENLQKRLHNESSLPQIDQFLIIVDRNIAELNEKKNSFNINKNYEEEFLNLNQTKSEINTLSSELSSLEFRKELIIESKNDLESEFSEIDTQQIKNLYEEAKVLIPQIQKTFEDTLKFHNQMVHEKIRYITQELPDLEAKISTKKGKLNTLLATEKTLTEKLRKSGVLAELQQIISELNVAFQKKGDLEGQKRILKNCEDRLSSIDLELEKIQKKIDSKDDIIQDRITEFNRYFSDISKKLYGEQFFLSSEKTDKVYELEISSLGGNLGTGKKKGQIAAFDLAYIKFAEALDIACLHFILHDQIENVHDNQISNLLTEAVSDINCQYILPVLRDKLPDDINVEQYSILTLSQSEKLFKIP